MAFIDPVSVDELKQRITNDLSLLGKLYNAKKNQYLIRSFDHNLVDEMISDGWEEFGSTLKTKTKLRKLKSHDRIFEDDVWCLLYELGYRCLNVSTDFHLPYGKESIETQQIDVIAVNDDSVLLVECKSSEQVAKPKSFKTEFEALEQKLRGFRKSVDQLFGKEKKVKYIFATRNLRIDQSSTDIQRLTGTGSFYFNENTYLYVKNLIKSYKDAALYQFLGLVFKGEMINKDRIEVPAIEGNMGGRKYYMFSIEPHLLLRMGFILHRTKAYEFETPTYQRLLNPNRLNGITKFIQNGGYFPNSIVLNFNTDVSRQNRLQFEPSARGDSTKARFGTLKIPNSYAIAYIIDGQHRVYGYANSDFRKSNTIPVVAFNDLKPAEQLSIFMQINENQKAVSATLKITLEEDLYWSSDRVDLRIRALRSSVIQTLGESTQGPLYNKIAIGEDKATLAAKPFASSLTSSGLIPTVNKNKYVEGSNDSSLYDTSNLDHESEMRRARDSIVKFVNLCYEFVEGEFPDVFEVPKSVILSNRGTYAFINLIGSLNSYLSKSGEISVQSDPSERFEKIKCYLNALLSNLRETTDEEEEWLWGRLGSGADVKWFRFFQELVHRNYPEYNPPELVDWFERKDKELQDRGRDLVESIEKYIKKSIIDTLNDLFDENWEYEIGEIKRECINRAEEEIEKRYKQGLSKKEIHWTDMFQVTDYKKIVEKFWSQIPGNLPSFSDVFSIDVGSGFNSRKEKISWFNRFISHRNSLAHAGTREKGLNKEEVMFLELIHNHFDLALQISES